MLKINDMKKLVLIILNVLILLACKSNSSQNKTITIGKQVWTSKNLNVKTFRNGDSILQVDSDEEWEFATQNKLPACCYFKFEPSNGTKYGILYNWYAVNDSRGLAPEGFHIPSDIEWAKLVTYLGGDSIAGKKIKSNVGWNIKTEGGEKTCPDCENWNDEYRSKVPCHTCKDKRSVPAPITAHSGNGTNSSGFFGLPGGYYLPNSGFDYLGEYGFWWSSTDDNSSPSDLAIYRFVCFGDDKIGKSDYFKDMGCSVRCIKD